MNKNFKVITINGIRGIIAVVFIIFGLIAGFIVSPGWLCMKLWNYCFEYSNVVSNMNIYQGIMLWAAIVLSLYALNNKKPLIGFGTYQGLSPEQIREIILRAKQAEKKVFKEMTKNIDYKNFDIKSDKIKENIEKVEEEKEELRR